MKHDKKLRQEEEATQQVNEQQVQSGALEFENADKMLRHDAVQTVVPPAIAHRLAESIAQTPASSRPWWRRLFGG